jgi:hypothetical protein
MNASKILTILVVILVLINVSVLLYLWNLKTEISKVLVEASQSISQISAATGTDFTTNVSINEKISVPIKTSVPINTTVSVPVNIPIVGSIRVTVPINTNVPINTSVVVPINKNIPVTIPAKDLPMGIILEKIQQIFKDLLNVF